jgi:hypothetical protein
MLRIPWFTLFIPEKTGVENELYIIHILQLVPLCRYLLAYLASYVAYLCIRDYLNVCNKINKCICMKYVSSCY